MPPNVDLANRYGARTVAEGVETRADFITARDLGFDLIQGFLFARPMDPIHAHGDRATGNDAARRLAVGRGERRVNF
jgi:EAL domain-containing protein (putative c-di-GMP-specific phosphodiesterase class I)